MKDSKYLLPGSILITSLLVAGSILITSNYTEDTPTRNVYQPDVPAEENVRPVTSRDNMLGSLNAPIKIIEFSDFECPFCKTFHQTMHRIVDDYDGQVAWVYRHFPSDGSHPNARAQAEASECVAHYGGNEAFWIFTDTIFRETPSSNRLPMSLLPDFAEEAGVSKAVFEACLRNGRFANRVQEDIEDAVNSGVRGTPYSIMIVGDDLYHVPLPGDLPYEAVRAYVERALELL